MKCLLRKISEAIRNYLFRTDPEYRWNNGGKEIHEKMQNDPDFMQTDEYQNYMNRLK